MEQFSCGQPLVQLDLLRHHIQDSRLQFFKQHFIVVFRMSKGLEDVAALHAGQRRERGASNLLAELADEGRVGVVVLSEKFQNVHHIAGAHFFIQQDL